MSVSDKPDEKLKTLFSSAAEPLIFIGAVVQAFPCLFRKRGRRWREFFYYFDLCGYQSTGIVLLICGLMGIVLGIQGVIQMRKVGTEIFMVDLIGFSVLKELGPLMVAMIATGRAGSAFAAEIGTMKVNEEISALRTMGINPEEFLVLPKLMAMLAAMPLLTVFGDGAGIVGGMIVGVTVSKIPLAAYWGRTVDVLDTMTFLLGIGKSFLFAILITLAGCYCGFSSSGDAQGVGRGATRAVVVSIFLVVAGDALMTLLYSFIGY